MNCFERLSACFGVLLFLSVVACESGQTQTNEPTESSEQAESQEATQVSRVVFVGLEDCCDCTANRIQVSWEALSAATAGGNVQVERIQSDTQPAEVSPYQEMRPIMVFPALYFLDGDGNLIEQLQGEVTVEQVESLIQR